jgi:MFS family permease
VLCGAMFISAVDMTIVNVALPDISEDLNAGVGELQWVLDGFLVAMAGLLLVGSGLADRFGRKRVFSPACWASERRPCFARSRRLLWRSSALGC